MIRSLILSTAALSLAALAQSCIASAKPARLTTVLYLFLGGLILFIFAFAKPLRGERRAIGWKALLALTGLFLASLAYLYLTQGEHFLLAVAFSLLSVVFLGSAFGQEDESGQGQAVRDDSRVMATEGLLLLLAVVTALLALFAWWRELDSDGALVVNFLSLALFIAAFCSLDRRARFKAPPTEKPFLSSWMEFLLLGLIVAVAAFMRSYRLEEMPYGVWYDAGEAALEAVKIVKGQPFTPLGVYSPNNPSLFFYLLALAFRLFGVNLLTMRLLVAAIGTLTVVAFYFLVRLAFGQRTALIAAALLAVSSWHVNFSRFGMGYSTLVPLFEVTTLYYLLKGLRSGRKMDFALGGLMLGLGLYSHTSFRLFPFVIPIYLLYGLVLHRDGLRERLAGLAIFAVICLLVFAPLGVYAAKHPDDFTKRMGQTSLFAWKKTPAERIAALESNVRRHALMFNYRGDMNGRHGLPGAPTLDLIAAPLLVLGFGYCLYRWLSPPHFLLALWFLITMQAGILSLDWEAPQAARTIVAIPAVYALAAVPLGKAWGAWCKAHRVTALISTLLVVALMLAAAYLNYDRYFNQQMNNSEVFHAFSTADTAVAYHVNQLGREQYRYYLQNQGTPAFRFLVMGLDRGLDERFFRIVDHLPILERPDKDVIYILEPWRVALPPESFFRYYPQGVYQEIEDPFGKTMFFTFSVKREDVLAIQGLVGRYYAGVDLTDEPQLTRRDATIAFDWSTENPLGQEPFSVAWGGTLFIPQSGTYALGTRSAGSSQVRFDGKLLVDNPGQRGGEIGLVEGSLTAAKRWHSLEINCLDCAGGPMELYWRAPGKEPEIVPQETLCTVPLASNGLLGSYYQGTDRAGPPVFQQVDPIISFRWHDDPLPVPWCAQWEGRIRLQEGGEYRFRMHSNDYAALHINGQQVVEYPSALLGSIQLGAGEHEILVKYSNTKHYSEMRLFWTPPGRSSSEAIPTEVLFPAY
jgi:4-amino-4-deoxy-L-arabinose transferase-like glycosyltransferase